MALQHIHMTKVSTRSSGQVTTTMPAAVRRALDMADRDPDERVLAFRARCHGSDLGIEIRIGPEVDPDASNTRAPKVMSTGQVQVVFPLFFAHAWHLDECELVWPDAEDVAVESDGSATLSCQVRDWGPKHEASLSAVLMSTTGIPHRSTLTLVGQDVENVEGAIPTVLADAVGVAEDGARIEFSMDCVDGRLVLVARPTDADRTEVRNSATIRMAGPNDSQARFNSKGLATALDVGEALATGPVQLRWFQQDDETLLAFVHEDAP